MSMLLNHNVLATYYAVRKVLAPPHFGKVLARG